MDTDYPGVPSSLVFAHDETEKSFRFAPGGLLRVEGVESLVLGFGTLPDRISAGDPNRATITVSANEARSVAVMPSSPSAPRERTMGVTPELNEGSGRLVTTTPIQEDYSLLPAPTGLLAEPGRVGGEVLLSWNESADADNIERHEYRFSTNGSYSDWIGLPASGGRDRNNGYANGLANGVLHTFQIRAIDRDDAASPASGTATATPQGTVPEVMLTSTALTVPEGESKTYTLALNVEPASLSPRVEVAVEGDNDVTVSPETVRFRFPWNRPRTVTVTAAHDDDSDHDSATISHTVVNYYGTTASSTAVKVIDDEAAPGSIPTVTLNLSQSPISEDGGTTAISASLDPVSSVTTTLAVSAQEVAPALAWQFSLSEARTLTIPAGMTSSSELVTITANYDASDTPDKDVTISATTSNTEGVLGPADVTLSITDDDDRGITVSPETLLVPKGDSRTYSIVLTSQPTGRVKVTPTSSEPDTVTVPGLSGPAVFAITTWDAPEMITVTAADDSEPGDTVTITHAVTGSDYEANGLTASSVSVTVIGVDVTGDGTIDEDDALVMYYAYRRGDLLGDGELGGDAQSRQQLLSGLSGEEGPGDEALQGMLRKANAWRSGNTGGDGDINGDGELDADDALAMYHAYRLEALLGDGEEGGAARLRQQLLGGFASEENSSDAGLRGMLRKANAIRNPGP